MSQYATCFVSYFVPSVQNSKHSSFPIICHYQKPSSNLIPTIRNIIFLFYYMSFLLYYVCFLTILTVWSNANWHTILWAYPTAIWLPSVFWNSFFLISIESVLHFFHYTSCDLSYPVCSEHFLLHFIVKVKPYVYYA